MSYHASLVALGLAGAILVPGTASTQQLGVANARIVDPESRVVATGALIVEDGRIVSIVASLPNEFAGQRIDAEGRWVVPGFVDMHTHSFGNMSPAGAPQFLGPAGAARAALYTGVIAFLDLFSPEDQILGLRDTQRRDGLPGAAIFAAGPCLTATSGHCSEYGVPTRIVDTPADAEREVTELAAKRPDVVKIVYDNETYGGGSMPTVDRATLEAVIATARAQGLKTVVHVGTWEDVRHAVEAGAAVVTHTPGPDLPPDGLAQLMVRQGTAHAPTLAVQSEFARIVDDASRLDDPLLAAVTTEGLRDAYRAPAENPRLTAWLARQREHTDANGAAVRALAEAGVMMLTGTDGGNFGVFQGYSVHREMALLVEAGLSEWDALAAATSNAAVVLDQPWGMSVGDEATFVILDASPLDDIRNTKRIHTVVQRGQLVDREALLANN